MEEITQTYPKPHPKGERISQPSSTVVVDATALIMVTLLSDTNFLGLSINRARVMVLFRITHLLTAWKGSFVQATLSNKNSG
jgi:hypothetical protein